MRCPPPPGEILAKTVTLKSDRGRVREVVAHEGSTVSFTYLFIYLFIYLFMEEELTVVKPILYIVFVKYFRNILYHGP